MLRPNPLALPVTNQTLDMKGLRYFFVLTRLGANPGAATGIGQRVTGHSLGNARIKTDRCSEHIVVTKPPNANAQQPANAGLTL
jgi:hypothetical protein